MITFLISDLIPLIAITVISHDSFIKTQNLLDEFSLNQLKESNDLNKVKIENVDKYTSSLSIKEKIFQNTFLSKKEK